MKIRDGVYRIVDLEGYLKESVMRGNWFHLNGSLKVD
jgi:hypothetical protein